MEPFAARNPPFGPGPFSDWRSLFDVYCYKRTAVSMCHFVLGVILQAKNALKIGRTFYTCTAVDIHTYAPRGCLLPEHRQQRQGYGGSKGRTRTQAQLPAPSECRCEGRERPPNLLSKHQQTCGELGLAVVRTLNLFRTSDFRTMCRSCLSVVHLSHHAPTLLVQYIVLPFSDTIVK